MAGVYKVKQEVFQRKCPNCGASLIYDPTQGKLFCEHCKSFVDFAKSKDVQERDFDDLLHLKRWDDGAVSYYRCENCGANTVLPRSTLATTCPYCSSPVVLDEKQTGLVRPDTIEPFELTAEQAKEFLRKWSRSKLFAPRKFRRSNDDVSVKGVYTPAWTFDLQTVTHYSGRLGRTRTRTVRRNGKSYTETYVQWFNVDDVLENSFDDIFVSGNNHISTKDFNNLDLTNQAKYAVYTDEYLAGYIADNYTVNPEVAYGTAVKKADGVIYNDIMRRHNADHDGGLTIDTQIIDRTFKYVMLPVYVVTSKYRNKVYNQYVSGVYSRRDNRKVKVSGKSPVSPWKVLACVLVGVGIVAGIIAWLLLSGGDWSFDWGGFDFGLLP
ncbi:MAG: hypothetical protein K2M64_00420 [Clostridia bacterium]|nr:hypothetical protein [Clostridia bacterium]